MVWVRGRVRVRVSGMIWGRVRIGLGVGLGVVVVVVATVSKR